tara:strand:- start:1304 stop:2422 length:1119 start_codon:yes stop_codon:yes gene_type:complete
MAKKTVYKMAESWTHEALSFNPEARPVDLHKKLKKMYPPSEVPDEHTVARWKRNWKQNQTKEEIKIQHQKFDPIDTFNHPYYRDKFSEADKIWILKFVKDHHVVVTQPMGLEQFYSNSAIEWAVKIKNAMPILANNPIDLMSFAQGFATIQDRPNSDDAITQAKNYLYAQPYYSVDDFKSWVRNAEDNNSLPVNIYEFFDLDSMRSDEDDWFLTLPQVIASNFATMPHVAPHIKMLTFTHQMLSNFISQASDSILKAKGDEDMLDEIKRNIDRVGVYIDKTVYYISEQTKDDPVSDTPDEQTMKLYIKIDDQYDVTIDKIRFSSRYFNWYYALMQNCFILAMSGGKLLDELTIIPYDQVLKWEDLLPPEKKD